MNLLRGLAAPKKKDATGALTGRTLGLGPYTVKVDAIIGEGGFATIYRAVEVNTQEAFALKHFMLSGDPEAERDVLTEVAIMNALAECPHTLTMRAHAMSSAEAVLLLDLCEGSLATHVMAVNAAAGSGRGGGLSDGEVVAVFLSVAKAVAAMHALTPPLAHRDVKAENVLQHPEGRWVLCDFGSASSEQKVYASAGEIAREEERIRKQTTPAYRAPEVSCNPSPTNRWSCA